MESCRVAILNHPSSRSLYSFSLLSKLQRRTGWHLVRARLVRGSIRRAVARFDQAVAHKIRLDFVAAYIGEHVAVDLNARAEHLAALLDHLLTLHRVVDDVAVLVGQIVFAEDGTDTLAPATGGFQVSDYFRFIHISVLLLC